MMRTADRQGGAPTRVGTGWHAPAAAALGLLALCTGLLAPSRAGALNPRERTLALRYAILTGEWNPRKHTPAHALCVAQMLYDKAVRLQLPRLHRLFLLAFGLDHDKDFQRYQPELEGKSFQLLYRLLEGAGPRSLCELPVRSALHVADRAARESRIWTPPREATTSDDMRAEFERGDDSIFALNRLIRGLDVSGRRREGLSLMGQALTEGTALFFQDKGPHNPVTRFAETLRRLPKDLKQTVIDLRWLVSLVDITSHSASETNPAALIEVLYGLHRELATAAGSLVSPNADWSSPEGQDRIWNDPKWLNFLVYENRGFFDQFHAPDFLAPDRALAKSFGLRTDKLPADPLAALLILMPEREAKVFALNRELADKLAHRLEPFLQHKLRNPRADVGSGCRKAVAQLISEYKDRYPTHPLLFK